MSDIAIKIVGLGKQYHIGQQQAGYETIREAATRTMLAPFRKAGQLLRGQATAAAGLEKTFWALQDISFEVQHGEVLGIIGRNGAGKSTLLKILSRITEPTLGYADVYGRIGSLLEVGTGFHHELTGRENIYLNGAILGMRRSEITAKFDEIVAFAEVEKFIDTPVKHYSSGMFLRLAFAVAAHLEPEILVVDEVLAVGDAAFRKKCLGKMEDVARQGRTVLFVSHDMGTISALCSRGIYLKNGMVEADTDTDTAIFHYLQDFKQTQNSTLKERLDRNGSGKVHIVDICFLDTKSKYPLQAVHSGQDITIEITYETADDSMKAIDSFDIGLAFYNSLGQFVMVLNSIMANNAFSELPPKGRVYCHVPRFSLMVGNFDITATLQVNGSLTDQVQNAASIYVETADFFGTGVINAYGRQGVYVPHSWHGQEPPLRGSITS